MSSDKSFLALRLEGPLQSWGFDSQYNRRNTGLMPTKSAIAGMCCAALGFSRGCDKEKVFLLSFNRMKMTAISIPRKGRKRDFPIRRMQDYHTVQNTKKASGGIKDCHITHRQYLCDASFGVILEGAPSLLIEIANAFDNPVWGIWLGRKTCIPSAPVFAGLKENRYDALCLLIGAKPIESFTRQVEVEKFADGRDSLPDNPVSFASSRRLFAPRRVKIKQSGEK
ncbi:MAG: type I-E CRISPR-associated protein Cas5/CasD [Candidatus Marinimicrobia bacterium]|nr:type I-E CRISPR-associated protein Cas5/CasD [Candidatus Neomarinimicrobiota bacterium]